MLAGCAPSNLPESLPDSGQAAETDSRALDPLLAAPLRAGLPVRALVRVDDAEISAEVSRRRTAADAAGDRPALIAARAQAWRLQADTFARSLPAGAVVERIYDHIPVVIVRLDREEAAQSLLLRRDIRSLEPETAYTAVTDNLTLIGQPAAVAGGYLGTGTSVAVLDTGADWTVADLGSCTAVGTPSGCRVAYAADFATSDNTRDDSSSHGTNVSSVVALVAPGADILALDVFNGGSASSTDILSAIDWVIANQATYHIASLNMSLGSGAYTSDCSTAFSAGISNARAAGVVVVAASGNNGYINAIAAPACDPGALSVGAVYDTNRGGAVYSSCVDSSSSADKVACFSNSASMLDILAPGTAITAGGLTMTGTSQASPHVAGAAAVLRATDAAATVDDLEDRLTTSGTTVTDTRNGLSFPRLALDTAVADCVSALSVSTLAPGVAGDSGSVSVTADASCAWTVTSDAAWLTLSSAGATGSGSFTWTAAANTGTARTANLSVSGRTIPAAQGANSGAAGSVTIASGASGTSTTAVTLTLAASDSDGVGTMCISNTASCTAWEAYATSRAWILSNSGTPRTVYATFRDTYGNTGAATTDTILYDTTAPTNGTVLATPAAGQVTLSWSGFADATSGVASYKVVRGTTSAPTTCSTGTLAYTGAATTTAVTGLTDGTTYGFRICAVDTAGNTGTGATVSATPQ